MYPHLITTNTVTIVRDGDTHTIDSSCPQFTKVLDLVRQGLWDEAIDAMSPAVAISTYAGTSLVLDGNTILRNGTPVDHSLVPHILTMRDKGFDIQPLMHFLDKVMQNPSMRSRNQLWRFVSTNNIAITPDGNLLFFKKVKDNYYDVHTGRSNQYTVGSTHTMPRHEVDDDPERTCSTGLHVCSYEYLRSFGGDRTLMCEVSPADVVSVPIDYHNTKVRVSSLRVLREVENPEPLDTGVYEECPF